jgi:hypothetical protein
VGPSPLGGKMRLDSQVDEMFLVGVVEYPVRELYLFDLLVL